MAIERYKVLNPGNELKQDQRVEVTLYLSFHCYNAEDATISFNDANGPSVDVLMDDVKSIVAEREFWEPQHLDVFRRWDDDGWGDDDGIYWIIEDGEDEYDENIRLMAQRSGDSRLRSLDEMNFREDELIYREGS